MQTYAQSINKALEAKLISDKRVVLLGEDIQDPYGGAFKVTKGLSSRYSKRIMNTPMSEYALTGIASGLALRGMRPVLEIMFGDFITICADQMINHAAKFSWMYNGQVSVPMVIRTPMGGRRGYGPTHSQTIEKIFFGVPGLKIIAPSNFHDPGKMLTKAIDDNGPVLFIENKLLYARKLGEFKDGHIMDFAAKISGDDYETITLSNSDFEGAKATILTYGGMLPFVIDAVNEIMEENEIAVEIVVPSYINGSAMEQLYESLTRTGRLVIVEEGTLNFGWGAEMSARIAEHALEALEVPIKRVAAKDLPIGCTKVLEDAILPQIADIKEAVMGVCQ